MSWEHTAFPYFFTEISHPNESFIRHPTVWKVQYYMQFQCFFSAISEKSNNSLIVLAWNCHLG